MDYPTEEEESKDDNDTPPSSAESAVEPKDETISDDADAATDSRDSVDEGTEELKIDAPIPDYTLLSPEESLEPDSKKEKEPPESPAGSNDQ